MFDDKNFIWLFQTLLRLVFSGRFLGGSRSFPSFAVFNPPPIFIIWMYLITITSGLTFDPLFVILYTPHQSFSSTSPIHKLLYNFSSFFLTILPLLSRTPLSFKYSIGLFPTRWAVIHLLTNELLILLMFYLHKSPPFLSLIESSPRSITTSPPFELSVLSSITLCFIFSSPPHVWIFWTPLLISFLPLPRYIYFIFFV